jgi:putative methyltransferase
MDDQIELSEYIKSINPDCFVIAGGPEVPWKDHDIFDQFPVLDAVCYAEIEKVLPTFFYNWQNNLDIDIDGIVLKNNPTKTRPTVPKLECKNVVGKPYTHLKDELTVYADEIKQKGGQHRIAIPFETNRGCPYGCTFCDWGSATLSKIKKFPREYIMEEIKTVMSWRPDLVLIVDANFGVFEDDLDYIYEFIKYKKQNNYISTIAFSSAKNKKTRATQAHVALHAEGMLKVSHMGIQHTDPEVTKNMDRDNIKSLESIQEINEGLRAGVPLVPALIVGSPGDSVNKWKTAVTDLMCMSFHDDIRLHDFQLLPNAPAMDPEYMEKFEIGYIEKTYHEMPNAKRKPSPAKFISNTYSYTKKDFVFMQTWSYVYVSLHVLGILKWPAMMAHHTLGITYKDFYDRIVVLPTIENILQDVYYTLEDFVMGDAQNKFIEYNNKTMQLESYFYIKCIEQLDTIYSEFRQEFQDDFGEYMDDIIEFSKFIQVNYNTATELSLSYDFKHYFLEILQTPALQKSSLLPTKKYTEYYNDGYLGLNKEYNMNKYLKLSEFTVDELKNELYNKIFKQAPNYRHRLYYYYGALNS